MAGLEIGGHRRDALLEARGWTTVAVVPLPGGSDSPWFAYTVGLTTRHLPELIVTGLDPWTGQLLLRHVAEQLLREGEQLPAGTRLNSGTPSPTIVADVVATDQYNAAYATQRYGEVVRLQQLVWADQQGRFPWETGNTAGAGRQELLPPASR